MLDFFFFFFVLDLIQLHIRVNYSIVLSANEIAECNKVLNKTKTVKHRCEKSKCRVAMWLKKNSWSNSFSSLTKTWNSPFKCLSIKICHTHNLFLLILFLRLKFKRSNSQGISFLAEIFGIAFEFTRSCLTKLSFSCSSKIYSDPWKIFPYLKIFFLFVGKISEVDSSLKR